MTAFHIGDTHAFGARRLGLNWRRLLALSFCGGAWGASALAAARLF